MKTKDMPSCKDLDEAEEKHKTSTNRILSLLTELSAKTPPRILLVGSIAEGLEEALEEAFGADILCAEDSKDAKIFLEHVSFDLVIVREDGTGNSGPLLAELREKDIPTVAIGESVRDLIAMSRGEPKNRIIRLPARTDSSQLLRSVRPLFAVEETGEVPALS